MILTFVVKSQNLAVIYHFVIPPGIPIVTFLRAGSIQKGKYDLVVALVHLSDRGALFYCADGAVRAILADNPTNTYFSLQRRFNIAMEAFMVEIS